MTPSADMVGLADKLDVIARDIARAHINGFGNQVTQVADELRALAGAEVGGWRSIDSAPQDGTEFQVWFDKYGWEPRCRMSYDGMIEVFGRVDYDMDGWETCPHMRATGWMPNPFPPGLGRGGP